MANENVQFMVTVMKAVGAWEGLGAHSFAVAPRAGEYVTFNDENGIAQAYRVKALLHPLAPAPTAGDLLLEYVGTDSELRTSFTMTQL